VSARAFTRQGEVFLPDEAGQLTAPEGRALLAHELVHATQQRMLGSNVPDERSAEGALLEATAVRAERWMRGHGDAPGALVHHPLPFAAAPPTSAVESAMQRAGVDDPGPPVDLAALFSGTHSEEPTGPSAVAVPRSITGVATESGPVIVVTPPPAAPAEPMAENQFDPTVVEVLRGRVDQLANTVSELAAGHAELTGIADRNNLDDLTGRFYQRIRDNIRQELIVDRERAGLLTDLR
jgi:hypothetical protein